VFRVANRTGLAPGKTVDAVEKKLMKVVPPVYMMGAHHWLILHGRYTCLARKPQCWSCVIADICPHKPKTPDPEIEAAAKAEKKASAKRKLAPPRPKKAARRRA